MSSNLPDRSSFGRKPRPPGFDNKARSGECLLAFRSARVSMAHQNVAAVPEIARAAKMAVKRDAPNTLIYSIRRFFAPVFRSGHAVMRRRTLASCGNAMVGERQSTCNASSLCRPIVPEIRPNAIFGVDLPGCGQGNRNLEGLHLCRLRGNHEDPTWASSH